MSGHAVSTKTPEFLAYTKELAAANNVWITPLYFDFLDPEQIKTAAHAIRDTKQPVDILVNIAGMTQDALFHMTTMDQMKKVFEVNFFSQMLLTQYITRNMVRHKSGSVINISSISAIDGNPGQLSYTASKDCDHRRDKNPVCRTSRVRYPGKCHRTRGDKNRHDRKNPGRDHGAIDGQKRS